MVWNTLWNGLVIRKEPGSLSVIWRMRLDKTLNLWQFTSTTTLINCFLEFFSLAWIRNRRGWCHRHTLQNHLAPKSHLCSPDSHLCFTWVSPLLFPVSYKYLDLICVPVSLATITLHSSLQTTLHCWLMGFCRVGGYSPSGDPIATPSVWL